MDNPVIQTRDLAAGETAGYSNTWTADRPARIATVAAGYADGLHRTLSSDGQRPRIDLFAGDLRCPMVGRVSMDLITVDVSHLEEIPESLDLIGEHQGIDRLADVAGTIGYELLTRMAPRLNRVLLGEK